MKERKFYSSSTENIVFPAWSFAGLCTTFNHFSWVLITILSQRFWRVRPWKWTEILWLGRGRQNNFSDASSNPDSKIGICSGLRDINPRISRTNSIRCQMGQIVGHVIQGRFLREQSCKVHQIVRIRNLNLFRTEERFQVLFRCLLGMEADDFVGGVLKFREAALSLSEVMLPQPYPLPGNIVLRRHVGRPQGRIQRLEPRSYRTNRGSAPVLPG